MQFNEVKRRSCCRFSFLVLVLASTAAASDLAGAAGPQANIRAALLEERNRTLVLATDVSRLREEAQAALRKLDLNFSLTSAPAELSKSTAVLNGLIANARMELEQRINDCRSRPQALLAEGFAAATDVQILTSEMSYTRAQMLQAQDALPEDNEWFGTLNMEVGYGRRACVDQQKVYANRSSIIQGEKQIIANLTAALKTRCASSFSLLQVPSRTVSLDVERPSSSAELGVSLLQVLHERQTDFGFMSKRGAPLSTELCEKVRDAVAKLTGKVNDDESRLRTDIATSFKACENDRKFERNQMTAVSRHKSFLASEVADTQSKLGNLSLQTRRRDEQRGSANSKAHALQMQCKQDVDHLLHDKLCSLHRLRDQLWLLAKRTDLPMDCEVSEWTLGACTKTCGGGTQTSTRQVVLPVSGGAACPPLKMVSSCATEACPVDCVMGAWSGWSECSALCDGGFQERVRNVVQSPQSGGQVCPQLVDMQACNSRACNRDCLLTDWSGWSTCSLPCGGGTATRKKKVSRNPLGDGICPKEDAASRLQRQPCNSHSCPKASTAVCLGSPQDLVLLVDSSGSNGVAGLQAFKSVISNLVQRYPLSEQGTRMAIASFADQAQLLSSGFEGNSVQLLNRLSAGLTTPKGASTLSTGLMLAGQLLFNEARAASVPTVLVLSDGRWVDPFKTQQAVAKLKTQGARILFVTVGPGKRESALAAQLASAPAVENVIEVKSLVNVTEVAGSILLKTCSSVS